MENLCGAIATILMRAYGDGVEGREYRGHEYATEVCEELERLVGEREELRERIDDWRSASGLTINGDPSDVEPRHLELDLRERDDETRGLKKELSFLSLEVLRRRYAMNRCEGGCLSSYEALVEEDVLVLPRTERGPNEG